MGRKNAEDPRLDRTRNQESWQRVAMKPSWFLMQVVYLIEQTFFVSE